MAAISAAERQRRDQHYEQGLKDCTCCRRTKLLADFYPRSDGYRGLSGDIGRVRCRRSRGTTSEGRSNYRNAGRPTAVAKLRPCVLRPVHR